MNHIFVGDSRQVLPTLPAASVHCCVTSPPYFGLRDYGHAGQIGLEPTPDAFIAELVAVFREVRRVLRDDGTLWLNIGDSYAGGGTIGRNDTGAKDIARRASAYRTGTGPGSAVGSQGTRGQVLGLKPKDLIGIPWMLAFALRADGWYLRSEIIWAKPNPMPESVTDRPTKAHEQIFLLSKSPKYFYDADAIEEPAITSGEPRLGTIGGKTWTGRQQHSEGGSKPEGYSTRNKRTVWEVASAPFSGAHFATFPPKLIEPCILAGCPKGGVVLDPFMGAGTTGMVAARLRRRFIGCELNPAYAEMARERICADAPLFNKCEVEGAAPTSEGGAV